MKLCVLFLGVFVAMATAKPQYSKKDIASLLERILSTRMGNGNGGGPLSNFPPGDVRDAIADVKEKLGERFDGDVPDGVKQAFQQFVVAARAAIAESASAATTETTTVATTEATNTPTEATTEAATNATTAAESAESAESDNATTESAESATSTSTTTAPERRRLIEKLLLLALDNKMKSKRSHNY